MLQEGGPLTGYFIDIVKNGDKIDWKHNSTYETIINDDGSWEMMFSGKWEATNGTGKFSGIKGRGIFSGGGTQQGFSFDWEGDFEFQE